MEKNLTLTLKTNSSEGSLFFLNLNRSVTSVTSVANKFLIFLSSNLFRLVWPNDS